MSRRPLSLLTALALPVALLGAVGAPAVAAAPVTQVFTSTSTEQTFIVPGGVYSVQVHAVGASGGCGFAGVQRGGDVAATVAVTPGQSLFVEVGGTGGNGGLAGFNGGGTGGVGAGGGGGASDVRTVAASTDGSLATRLVVAGGGGGGGGFNSNCQNASATAGIGSPGTATAGGTGGTSTGCAGGGDGTLGVGGAGASGCSRNGGGGGGGLYGGGGGGGGIAAGGAGGAGSSAAPGDPAAVITTDTTGVPKVELTWTPAADVATSPAAVAFATQTLGTTSPTQPVTLTNTGTDALVVSGISLTGAHPTDFFAQSTTCLVALPVGGTCQVLVAFKPTAAGSRSATLAIASNSTKSPTTVLLTGTSVSNDFGFGSLKRNTTKGTAKLSVSLPGPGQLALAGRGVQALKKSVTGSTVKLTIRPKSGLHERLVDKGTVKVKVKVTFTPTGGIARTKAKTVKLVLK